MEYTTRFLAVSSARTKGVAWAAEKAGVSVRTIYRWMKRFTDQGRDGLRARSRRPLHSRTLDRERRSRIVDLRLSLRLGCEKIAFEVGCSASTVHRVLRDLGLIWDDGKRTRWKFYERKHANSLWQLDYTMLRDGLWLLLVIDDHSRFVVGHRFMPSPDGGATIALLRECFSRYGVPRQLLTDHGSQFYAAKGGESAFDAMCSAEGVEHVLASVRHPQTVGKLERKNGVLKDELRCRTDLTSATDAEVRAMVDEFVAYHNYSRMHFAYEIQDFGVRKRKKVLFLPYLRFVCHR